jgi:hypothetical protein
MMRRPSGVGSGTGVAERYKSDKERYIEKNMAEYLALFEVDLIGEKFQYRPRFICAR